MRQTAVLAVLALTLTTSACGQSKSVGLVAPARPSPTLTTAAPQPDEALAGSDDLTLAGTASPAQQLAEYLVAHAFGYEGGTANARQGDGRVFQESNGVAPLEQYVVAPVNANPLDKGHAPLVLVVQTEDGAAGEQYRGGIEQGVSEFLRGTVAKGFGHLPDPGEWVSLPCASHPGLVVVWNPEAAVGAFSTREGGFDVLQEDSRAAQLCGTPDVGSPGQEATASTPEPAQPSTTDVQERPEVEPSPEAADEPEVTGGFG